MERVIEFPIEQEDIFTQSLSLAQGYCVCYQYDVDRYGYGPYGFHTANAKRLLNQVLPPLVYWHPDRETLMDVDTPVAEGVYFFKGQDCIRKMEAELLTYQKAEAMQALRHKYGKSEALTPKRVKPALLEVPKGKRIPAAFITRLLANNCSFLVSYSYNTEAGQILVFFSESIKSKIKSFSESADIRYSKISSIKELKPW